MPVFIIIFALGNFLGPLTLGRLFDTVGRKPMIAGSYLGSAAVGGRRSRSCSSTARWASGASRPSLVVTFFLASAGASAAYLTVSEIFPMETRALAIAFFYAVGHRRRRDHRAAALRHLIGSGDRGQVIIAFLIGAGVMAIGGIAELLFGVKAEQAKLEDIAQPLTAEEAEEDGQSGEADENHGEAEQDDDRRIAARAAHRRARERHGFRRYRPGPGGIGVGPDGRDLDREIDTIGRALEEHGETTREELNRLVGGRYWGPGRFRAAVREAVEEGRARPVSRSTLAPTNGDGPDDD